MKSLFRSLIFLGASAIAAAAPLTRDLGSSLVLYRVHALPADLPAKETGRKQPAVLDLRYVRAEADAVASVVAWIRFRAGPHAPVFVLVNAETDPALLAALHPRPTLADTLIIGTPTRGFAPDIAVQTSPADERRAYDALEAGAPLPALLVENADKARNDEASLAKDRSTDPDANDAPGAVTAKLHAPPPPIDAALQRAVHLHRALVALRKL
ncbi:MAG TPA: hypothetical protein VHD62_07895 [Opitutaceae bacterium]|nr:hypothetical protein [Opitutaceae bacterium]